jgi:hypothetical protein
MFVLAASPLCSVALALNSEMFIVIKGVFALSDGTRDLDDFKLEAVRALFMPADCTARLCSACCCRMARCCEVQSATFLHIARCNAICQLLLDTFALFRFSSRARQRIPEHWVTCADRCGCAGVGIRRDGRHRRHVSAHAQRTQPRRPLAIRPLAALTRCETLCIHHLSPKTLSSSLAA